jgi:hypothetical protein
MSVSQRGRAFLVALIAMFISLSVAILVVGGWIVLERINIFGNGSDGTESNALKENDAVCWDSINLAEINPRKIDIIGDSLIVGAETTLLKHDGVRIDAMTNRSFAAVFSIIESYGDSLREYLVIGLTNNSILTVDELNYLLETVGPDRTIVFILGYSYSPAYARIYENNRLLVEFSDLNANVYLANWPEIVEAHPEYLSNDGTHLGTVAGQQAYAEMIFGLVTRGEILHCDSDGTITLNESSQFHNLPLIFISNNQS